MSKHANPALIGGFVVGAIALVVVAILFFGGGRVLSPKLGYVAYFQGSMKGLAVGSPVLLKGVRVGTVADIRVQYDEQLGIVRIPVFINLEPNRVEAIGGISDRDEEDNIKRLIDQGLRAQLGLLSLVTGQLYVDLDFHPNAPLILVSGAADYPELPTIPSTLELLSKTLDNLPLEELVSSALSTIHAIEQLASAPEIRESLRTLNQSLKDFQTLINNVNQQVKPLSANAEFTLQTFRTALIRYQKMAESIDGQVVALVTSVRRAADSVDSFARSGEDAAVQARDTLVTIDDVLAKDAPLQIDLSDSLKDLGRAARSIRQFADYLERHPDSLLYGKSGSRR